MESKTAPPDRYFAADDAEARSRIQQLTASLATLERAMEEGKPVVSLAEQLLSSRAAAQLCFLYRELEHQREPPGPLRRRLVSQILDEVSWLGAPPARWFMARPVLTLTSSGATRLVGGWVRLREGEVFVRQDQMLAARDWGTGYRFASAAANAALARSLVIRAVVMLAQGLDGAARLDHEGRGCMRPAHEDLGRRYERLMLDVLNERACCASPGSLRADLFEKTDLWLYPPGLPSRRARVQVSLVHQAAFLEQKLSRIARPEELVILTPRTLAIAVEASRWEAPLLSAPELASLQCGSLAYGAQSIARLASCFKKVFLCALEHPTCHPLGPMAMIPETVRRLVREFAAREAWRSLEAREARVAGCASLGARRRSQAAEGFAGLSIGGREIAASAA